MARFDLVSLTPYDTHQVIEWPPLEMAVHHFVLPQGQCPGCGRQRKAQVPSHQQAGDGPRLSARSAELAGTPRPSWRLVQDCCHSGFTIPSSLGAGPKVIHRLSQALVPHYEAMATLAHQAPGGSSDETPWSCHNALPWLWSMATDTVAYYRIDPHRSQAAFVALLDAWQGILGSDGDGVSQAGGHQRHTGLAQLIRTARGLSQRRALDIAACGPAGTAALVPHGPRATRGRPVAGVGCALLPPLIERDQQRSDEAGRVGRRVAREMASLWVLLREHGVEPTNNLAERGLRFGVMWRTTSHGTDSEAGNRWVERTLSLRQTCRQLGQSTLGILVDAVTSLFQGRQPNLAWLY